ncbi:zinc ABC transporter permease (plasmid) [Bacillus sp. JAS24-2]|uniref:metal ABC transporter permease n=1 Tax=Bacillus sp. JAS24-2 TaxID=2217832 RepID=UPI0011F0420E|nr:iron chelate uptake ABC transporter family permease subunit [Bacillus sp. JAS24-2]QEL82925.1 zinc ABC transporter permease [Bacillus sp. JAS24-2]
MLHFGFMQRAFLAGGLIAIISPIFGLFLILRRQSLMADTLSHISLAGIALGLTLHSNINLVMIIVIIIGTLGIESMRNTYRTYSELSIAILMATGLSFALVLMSLNQGGFSTSVEQYLFGSIITINKEQLYFLVAVSILVGIYYLVFQRPMYVLTFDEDTAFTSGLPIKWLSLSFNVLTGLTISVMMPIIGALLVSALMVLPAAIAMRMVKGFKVAVLFSITIGIISMFLGLTSSYKLGTPPGATITLVLVLFLLFGLFIQWVWKSIYSNRV